MSEKPKDKPNYLLRRLGAAGVIGVLGLTGAGVVHQAKETIQEQEKITRFSQPGIANEIIVDKNSSTSIFVQGESENIEIPVTRYVVQPGETAIGIANDLGAIKTLDVAHMISGQVGGAENLQPGDEVVIPSEQLEQLPQSDNH